MTDSIIENRASSQIDYEVIIIGTGIAGTYQLYTLLKEGFDVIALESNADVGGTWFNNRYPGCRFDSESHTYGYSFSPEILEKWDWKELFSSQPENLRYMQFVADQFGLRDHVRFNTEVTAARFDEENNRWVVQTKDGADLSCRYLVAALGGLSTPTIPRLQGIDDFKGQCFHTFDWPHEPVELAGKRVAVFGTGATGVQVIQTIAETVGELIVFQRRPNWCAPLNNKQLTKDDMDAVRGRYEEIFETCAVTPGGFEHVPDRRGFYDVSREERLALWEKLYDEPGFGILVANFVEIFVDEKANAEFSEFIAEKIRGRVNDPILAEELIPKDHGFGVQRVPLETRYYEAYNRSNVHLLNIVKEPVERISARGVVTAKREYEFDLIIFATGFDAVVGSYNKVNFEGVGGLRLRDKWKDGPVTNLGMLSHAFPNLLIPAGPQSGGGSINFPRAIEMCVNWTTGLLKYMRDNGKTRFESSSAADEHWGEAAARSTKKLLLRKAQNWISGINHNIEGRDKKMKRALGYYGGNPKYRSMLDKVAANEYEGIDIT